ncbi:MAG: methyl-accepting chemotaxis protein, partial [Nitrospinales bacterium]
MGPEVLDLLVSAIYDNNKKYIGSMVTWEVITEKLRLEKEADELKKQQKETADDLKQKVEA